MKRDMDLARQIMLELEQMSYTGRWVNIAVPGHSDEEVGYHIMQLYGAGFVDAVDLAQFPFADWKAKGLTWQGHEFLDAARDQNTWNQAKKTIGEKGGSLTFDVLKGVLTQLARQTVGL